MAVPHTWQDIIKIGLIAIFIAVILISTWFMKKIKSFAEGFQVSFDDFAFGLSKGRINRQAQYDAALGKMDAQYTGRTNVPEELAYMRYQESEDKPAPGGSGLLQFFESALPNYGANLTEFDGTKIPWDTENKWELPENVLWGLVDPLVSERLFNKALAAYQLQMGMAEWDENDNSFKYKSSVFGPDAVTNNDTFGPMIMVADFAAQAIAGMAIQGQVEATQGFVKNQLRQISGDRIFKKAIHAESGPIIGGVKRTGRAVTKAVNSALKRIVGGRKVAGLLKKAGNKIAAAMRKIIASKIAQAAAKSLAIGLIPIIGIPAMAWLDAMLMIVGIIAPIIVAKYVEEEGCCPPGTVAITDVLPDYAITILSLFPVLGDIFGIFAPFCCVVTDPPQLICPPGKYRIGTTCYDPPPAGYSERAGLYWQNCPSGFDDNGTFCTNTTNVGAGRIPPLNPCPDGSRDDGTSCWGQTGQVCGDDCSKGWDPCRRRGLFGECWGGCRESCSPVFGIIRTAFQRGQFTGAWEEKIDGLNYNRCPDPSYSRVPAMPYLCRKNVAKVWMTPTNPVPVQDPRPPSIRGMPPGTWTFKMNPEDNPALANKTYMRDPAMSLAFHPPPNPKSGMMLSCGQVPLDDYRMTFNFCIQDFKEPRLLQQMCQFYYDYAYMYAAANPLTEDGRIQYSYINKIVAVIASSELSCDILCELKQVKYDPYDGSDYEENIATRKVEPDEFKWSPRDASGNVRIFDRRFYFISNSEKSGCQYSVTGCTHADGLAQDVYQITNNTGAPVPILGPRGEDTGEKDYSHLCFVNFTPSTLTRGTYARTSVNFCRERRTVKAVVDKFHRENPTLHIKTITRIDSRGNDGCYYEYSAVPFDPSTNLERLTQTVGSTVTTFSTLVNTFTSSVTYIYPSTFQSNVPNTTVSSLYSTMTTARVSTTFRTASVTGPGRYFSTAYTYGLSNLNTCVFDYLNPQPTTSSIYYTEQRGYISPVGEWSEKELRPRAPLDIPTPTPRQSVLVSAGQGGCVSTIDCMSRDVGLSLMTQYNMAQSSSKILKILRGFTVNSGRCDYEVEMLRDVTATNLVGVRTQSKVAGIETVAMMVSKPSTTQCAIRLVSTLGPNSGTFVQLNTPIAGSFVMTPGPTTYSFTSSIANVDVSGGIPFMQGFVTSIRATFNSLVGPILTAQPISTTQSVAGATFSTTRELYQVAFTAQTLQGCPQKTCQSPEVMQSIMDYYNRKHFPSTTVGSLRKQTMKQILKAAIASPTECDIMFNNQVDRYTNLFRPPTETYNEAKVLRFKLGHNEGCSTFYVVPNSEYDVSSNAIALDFDNAVIRPNFFTGRTCPTLDARAPSMLSNVKRTMELAAPFDKLRSINTSLVTGPQEIQYLGLKDVGTTVKGQSVILIARVGMDSNGCPGPLSSVSQIVPDMISFVRDPVTRAVRFIYGSDSNFKLPAVFTLQSNVQYIGLNTSNTVFS